MWHYSKCLGLGFASSQGSEIGVQTPSSSCPVQIFSENSPSLVTIPLCEYTCWGTAGLGSNVSCWSWVSTALGGLSVTPRAGVKVDQQPDGFMFPHSFSLFSYCCRYPRASQILKRWDFMKTLVTFAKQERWAQWSKWRFETYTKGFQAICNDIKEIHKLMVGLSFFWSIFGSTWGQKCHTYPPLKIKTGQRSHSCGHINRLCCFLRHRLCCSCFFGGWSWITLFSLPFDPTPCKQAMLNGNKNVSG